MFSVKKTTSAKGYAMPYIKILTALTMLALLTACAGGVTINPTVINNGEGTSVPCEMNPFGDACLADTDLNPRRVEIVSDCRTDKMGDLCEDAIEFACGISIDDTICNGIMKYEDLRKVALGECLTNNSKEFCDNQTRVRKCDASPFPDNCIEPKYVMQRRIECESLKNKSQCMATEELICGANGDVFDPFCNGITNYVSVRETTCQTHGTDPTDGDSSCATILIPLCTIANPFAHEGCDDVEGINANIRTPYCQTPANAWKPKCMDGMHGTVTATRVTACQMFGTGMGGDDSCATSLTTVCDDIDNPFIYPGCDNVAGIDDGVRTIYCQTPATAWDEECIDTTHGTVSATRMTACQMFGTGMGGDDSCATSLISVCLLADPFIYEGCDDVVGINDVLRKMYCEDSATAWDEECMNGTHGNVVSFRTIACLESPFGTPADPLCATDSFTESACGMDPFAVANPGCANLTDYKNIVKNYCTMNTHEQCTAKYSFWKDSFTDELATALPTSPSNQFLQGTATGLGTIADEDSAAVTLDTAKFDTLDLGGQAADGFAYYTDDTNHYAGILLNTDLGAPLKPANIGGNDAVGIWQGQFSVINGTDAVESSSFHLQIRFDDGGAGAIKGETLLRNYVFTGDFDALGVIDGTITHKVVVGSGLDNRRGVLSGLIGLEGAVGVFHSFAGEAESYSGGFVARPPSAVAADDDAMKVTYADWLAAVSPDATANTVTRRNQFLQDAPNGTFTGSLDVVNFAEGHVGLNIEDIGGDAKNGFALTNDSFGPSNDKTYYFYAGIFKTTDLGAPLNAQYSGDWKGGMAIVSQAGGSTTAPAQGDFTLSVNFNKKSFVGRTQSSYAIRGTFNDRGVMTGTVLAQAYLDDAGTILNVDLVSGAGFVSGLIGQDGAVGVFYTNNDDIGRGNLSGGFFAAPPNLDTEPASVNYGDWTRSFTPALKTEVPLRTIASASARDNYFISGLTPASLDNYPAYTGSGTTTGIYFAESADSKGTLTLGDNDIGGDSADGVAFVNGTFQANIVDTSTYHAGILVGTDMGAPINDVGLSGSWKGWLKSVGLEADTAFHLMVDFTNSSISGFVPTDSTDYFFDINGKFHDATGVITGAVNLGQDADGNRVVDINGRYLGFLTGIIGADGLVAAFHSDNDAFLGFVGGFVAVPRPPDSTPSLVTYADWTDSYRPALPTAPTTTTLQNEFLQTTGATIATGTLTANAGAALTPTTLTINANDGVAFYQGYKESVSAFYAGIFATTDLGAPFNNTAPSAEWNGQFQAIGADEVSVKTDFVLEVGFGGTGDTAGSVEAFVAQGRTDIYYFVEGTYNRRGVISGRVRFGGFANSNRNQGSGSWYGTLTGLIGAEGAVGAFFSNPNVSVANRYGGGFVAAPTAPDPEPLVVNHGDWLRDFFKAPPATIALSDADTGVFGGFLNLASGETTIAPGDLTLLTAIARGAGNTMPAVPKSLPRASDAMDGVVYITGFRGDNNQTFVGLLPTTNLGAPFPMTDESAEWAGTYYDSIASANVPVTFDINFNTRSIGTTTATTTAGTTPDFDLEFNNAGVITGTVTKNSMEATAHGLIGAEGLVGGFVDTTTRAGTLFLFHGGFVADNANNSVAN